MKNENRERFCADAMAAWVEYQATGRHATTEEATLGSLVLRRAKTQNRLRVTFDDGALAAMGFAAVNPSYETHAIPALTKARSGSCSSCCRRA
jgi:hypothetical protein